MKKYILPALLILGFGGLAIAVSTSGGGSGGSGSSGSATWPVSGTPSDLMQKNSSGTITGSYQLNSNTSFYGPVQISSTVRVFTLAPDDQWILESSDITFPGNMRLGSNTGTQGGFFHFSTNLGIDRLKFGYADASNPGLSFTTLAGANKFFIASNGNIGVNTAAPIAVVQISSPAGTIGPLLVVSTGGAPLLWVSGTSITATATPLTVSSLTITGGASFVGSGAAYLGGNGEIQLDANTDGVKNLSVTEASVTLKDGMFISLRDKDRFTTPAFGSGTFITYIATPTMGISSSTLGTFQFSAAISSQANFCVFPWFVPDDIDLTAPISVSSFGIVLGAADTNSHVYQVSIATNQSGSLALETRFSGSGAWTSSTTIVIPADGTGAAGDLETSTGTIVWGGIQNTLIPGMLHYIIVSRDGDHGSDTSSVNSYSSFFAISYKRRFYQ